MQGLYLKIFGEVQGVGFRYSIREEAQRLGLTGWARNLPDGSVEVAAQGPKPALEKFLAWCYEGPPGAAVSRVASSWGPISTPHPNFTIQ